MADYSELDVYYYTEDHIGRPFALRDDDQVLRWFEHHYPFGEVIEEDTPNGDISAGLGDYAITWKPNFRFPGQYQDIDMFPFTHNHYREYLPQFGRYNRVDPISDFNNGNFRRIFMKNPVPYSYSLSSPVNLHDKLGLIATCDVVSKFCSVNITEHHLWMIYLAMGQEDDVFLNMLDALFGMREYYFLAYAEIIKAECSCDCFISGKRKKRIINEQLNSFGVLNVTFQGHCIDFSYSIRNCPPCWSCNRSIHKRYHWEGDHEYKGWVGHW